MCRLAIESECVEWECFLCAPFMSTGAILADGSTKGFSLMGGWLPLPL